MASKAGLFSTFQLGEHKLSHRLVMAPLTRFRVNDDSHVPLPFVKDYYVQRASTPGTLIITEGALPNARGGGWANAPGIWSDDQIAAWKEIVQGVHAAGGVIFMQLFAMGRVADPAVLEKEGSWKVKGPSAIIPDSEEGVRVHEMGEEEIWTFVEDFAQAARNAVKGAGFDGVEVHAANGYLLDQFLQDVSNHRTDNWGGSIQNRSRFALEITRAVIDAVGEEKVGFRVSPWSDFQGVGMKDPIPQFSHLISKLKEMKLAYLHLIDARVSGATDREGSEESLHPFTQIWGRTSPLLIGGGFTPERARQAVEEEYPDNDVAIVFGRYFLSTPDLVYRVQHGIPLNPYNRSLFYAIKSEQGYIDYPFSKEFLAEKQCRIANALA